MTLESDYEYGVQVHIEKEMLILLSENGYSLCIRKILNDIGATNIGRVAVDDIVTAHINAPNYANLTTFRWNKSYAISATCQVPDDRGRLDDSDIRTDTVPIALGESLDLKNWATCDVVRDDTAPKNGFVFRPGKGIPGPGALCVVYLADNNFASPGALQDVKAPFYISPLSVMGGTESKLIPDDKVVVFFCQEYEQSGGLSFSRRRLWSKVVDLSKQAKSAIKLMDIDSWKEVSWVKGHKWVPP
ncbi:hypothetical protein DXG01_004761 [Tephrocybe rancida]|nr:hypothetical protein DXG01_004761 [Tephrocybe rancida]